MKFIEIIKTAIIAASIIATAVILNTSFQQYLKIQAVHGCANTSQVNWSNLDNNSQTKEPYPPAYEKCLKDKGY